MNVAEMPAAKAARARGPTARTRSSREPTGAVLRRLVVALLPVVSAGVSTAAGSVSLNADHVHELDIARMHRVRPPRWRSARGAPSTEGRCVGDKRPENGSRGDSWSDLWGCRQPG